jgi:peroxiredoxin Q/BCP
MLTVADLAPDFELPIAGEGVISLRALRGQNVILFFYPKDGTPGCTAEALSFTEAADAFQDLGVTVIGISPDSPKKHLAFQAKYALRTILASDETVQVAKLYGVWVEKTLYGRKSFGVARTTFWIDPEGRIKKIWTKIKPALHGSEVLTELQKS